MQRGEMAIMDKWTRAEMAVKNGANLVVEMPAIFACNNAGYFARGGVEILEALGVSTISFGSELGNMDEIARIARVMADNEEIIENAVKEDVKVSGNSQTFFDEIPVMENPYKIPVFYQALQMPCITVQQSCCP